MGVMGAMLKAVGVAVVIIVGAAFLIVAIPAVRAQMGDEPMVDIRTQVFGGSEIGVRMRDVTADDVTREKLASVAGAIVTEIRPNGAAAAGGVLTGDVIVSFDGERVRSSRHLARLIEETPEGREVPLEVMRAGRSMTLRVRPAPAQTFAGLTGLDRLRDLHFTPQRLERFEGLRDHSFVLPGLLSRTVRLGVHVQELSGQLGDYFGAASGALVTSVDDNSPAKTAGLKAGDVITAINGQPVRTSADIQRRLAGIDGKATVTLIRDKKEMTIDVTIAGQPTTRRGIVK